MRCILYSLARLRAIFEDTVTFMMKISTKVSSNVLVVNIEGKFNIEEVVRFEDSINFDPATKIQAVALSFSAIDYVDSSALGSLIKLMNKAKNLGIEFILFDMTAPILSIFRLAYLDKFFTITTKKDLENRFAGIDL